MSQEHYLPFFVGDFLASTATWTGPERGLYMQLLALQWATGPLPCDPDRLALALHYEVREFRKLWATVSGKFQNGDGRLTNPRLEAVRVRNAEVQASRIAKSIAAANARWNAPSIRQASPEHGSEQCSTMPSDPIRSESDPILPEPEGKTARARRSLGHRLPEAWKPSPEGREFAVALELDADAVLAEFGDYWRGVPGSRGRKVDWEATWRNRCREIAGRKRAPLAKPKPVITWRPPPDDPLEKSA